jgi:hypothetical protein
MSIVVAFAKVEKNWDLYVCNIPDRAIQTNILKAHLLQIFN